MAANLITTARMLLSFALLLPKVFSPVFYVLYALCGISDAADGFIARRTGTQSGLGEALDAAADLIFFICCAVRILPAVEISKWLLGWISAIALIRLLEMLLRFRKDKKLLLPHTAVNKLTGLLLFLLPAALPFIDFSIAAIPVCALATFAAAGECAGLMRENHGKR